MSHFYATIQGNRGATSRGGSPASGIVGHVRGWNVGVHVYGCVRDGADTFDITATGGSHNSHGTLLGQVKLDADGVPTFTPAR